MNTFAGVRRNWWQQAGRPTAAGAISCLVGFEWDLLEAGSSPLTAKQWKKNQVKQKVIIVQVFSWQLDPPHH